MTDMSNVPKKSRKLIDEEQLQEIKSALRNAPAPARKMTFSETLESLSTELKEACVRGHNASSIAAVLSSNGLNTNERAVTRAMRLNTPKSAKKNLKLSAASAN